MSLRLRLLLALVGLVAVGLLVALPCVFAYNVLQKRVRDLIGETEALGRRLGASARAEAKRR